MAADRTIIFDGDCGLCSLNAAFIRRHDRQGHYRLLAAQSDEGSDLLRRLGFDPERLDTLVFVEERRVFIRSAAAIRIFAGLGGPWRLSALALLVPRPLRDAAYDLIARNRYRLFGHMTCETAQTSPDSKTRPGI